MDPGAPTALNKQGKMALALPKSWVKSPSFAAGQTPVMRYNRDLMMAILWGRMPYLAALLNTEVISLDEAPEAYKVFHDGSPKKYVIDPHNVTKLAGGTETARAKRPRVGQPAH